jgi:CheY-like chemotaxis protein
MERLWSTQTHANWQLLRYHAYPPRGHSPIYCSYCTLSSVLSKSQTLSADKLFYFLQVLSGRCKISTTEDKARKKRIFLVDDELDITLTLKIALEASGFFQVEAFYDSALALSRFKAGVYDLALLDIRMPEMNGFELCRKLKEIDNKLKICFLTATDPDLYRGTDLSYQ